MSFEHNKRIADERFKAEVDATAKSRMAHLLSKLQEEADRRAADPEYQAQQAAEQAKREVELAAYRERIWRDDVASYVPLRVARHIWSPNGTDAIEIVSNWVKGDRSKDLVLRGGVGTGKSTAIACAVKTLCEPSVMWGELGPARSSAVVQVAWLRPDALVSAIMHAYDDKAPKLREYVVIDDLGRETRPEFVEAFCDLLDREGHTLLITTNLTKEEMRKRYDLRVLDRLNERAIAFDIPGESMRAQNGGF